MEETEAPDTANNAKKFLVLAGKKKMMANQRTMS